MSTSKNDPFNPFAAFDMRQFDLTKLMGNMQMPGVDMEAMMASQRKNLEALAQANQVAAQGMQTVVRRQTELLAEAMAQANEASRQLTGAGNPQEMTTRQAELVRQAFEKAINDMRELAELVNKANADTFEVVNRRFNESLEELRSMVEQYQANPPKA
ncbi:MAG: phasin family protein [Candidatus Competibacterales bacterium]